MNVYRPIPTPNPADALEAGIKVVGCLLFIAGFLLACVLGAVVGLGVWLAS